MLCPVQRALLRTVASRPALCVRPGAARRCAPLCAGRPARLFSVVSTHKRDDEGHAPASRTSELLTVKKEVATSLAAAGLLSGLPMTTVFAAGADAAAPFVPLVSGASLYFLQVFPPIAAQAVFLAPMDAMKTIKENGDVGDMPLLPYAAMAVNGVGWVAYGLLQGQPTIWVPNITAFGFGCYYWYTYSQYSKSSNAPWLAGGAACVAAIGGLATATDPIMGMDPSFILGLYLNAVVVAMFGGPLAALKTVIDTKDTSSIPFKFSLATFVNCSVWTAFGVLVVNDPMVWFCNLLGLGSATAQLGCHAAFGIDGAGAKKVDAATPDAASDEAAPAAEDKDEKADEKKEK